MWVDVQCIIEDTFPVTN